MTKFIETTGRTEDDAVNAALRELGKSRDEVSVEVLERARSGFLGFGGSPAKVRVSWEEVESEVQRVETFLAGLFQRMGVDAVAEAQMQEDGSVSVELKGERVGALIGRRGETLDAIQHLTNYVLNAGSEERTRVNIDAENYRAKRAEALSGLAKKTATKVVRYRRNQTLEPMNAYERHVIHTALQDFDGVTTFSTGTEPNRRVVIAYDAATAPRDTYRDRRDDRPRDRRDSRPPRRQQSSGYSGQRSAYQSPAPEKPPVDKTVREWN